jgi:predicted hydrolase (HD superfamily)
MDGFDQLAVTPAARDALGRLRDVTGERDGPMERHCLRTRYIADEIARRRGWGIDGEVLVVAAILHDIGIYPAASRGGVYTAEGAALAREMLPGYGWSEDRIERCADAIDRHHDMRRQLARGGEVEALRLADLVDVSGGLVRAGVDRAWLRSLNRAVPRAGLGRELARLVGGALRERPLTMPQIFLR